MEPKTIRESSERRNSNSGYRGQRARKGKGKAKQDCIRPGKRKYSVEVRVGAGGGWEGKDEDMSKKVFYRQKRYEYEEMRFAGDRGMSKGKGFE